MTKKEYMAIVEQRLANVRDEQARGVATICPRCGAEFQSAVSLQPMSSEIEVHVCNDCIQQEQWNKMVNKEPLPIEMWDFARPDIDDAFLSIDANTAWGEIKTQIPALLELFESWDKEHDDDAKYAYAFQAIQDFKGVTDAWYAKRTTIRYAVRNGEITVMIEKRQNGETAYAAKLEEKGAGVRWLT